MMLPIKTSFDLLGDDTVQLSTENESLKIKVGSYDENWSEDFNAKLLNHFNDKKKAGLRMLGMDKQEKKHYKTALKS